jgi:hypothetical protein
MADTPFNWACKYCGQPTTITSPHYFSKTDKVEISATDYQRVHLSWTAISCPNSKCKKITFALQIYSNEYNNGWEFGEHIKSLQVLPESEAKPQPQYIPQPICEDYYEACRIRDLSPKASATLSRRCLQGMIRDFFKDKIKTGRLVDEIEQLKNYVDGDTWSAIDAVRQIGNIGAHMEEDVNLIIEVEPEEAQSLIELIETLFDDWYVVSHEREKRMKGLSNLAKQKKQEKKKTS